MSFVQNIKIDTFHRTIQGKKVGLFYLRNKNGVEAIFSSYGQRLISLKVPDKWGNLDNIVLGYEDFQEYLTDPYYCGAIVGRYANRIAKGAFKINDTVYKLNTNDGINHLHGGNKGFDKVVWDVIYSTEKQLIFERISPHNEEGYPGNLYVTTTYTLTDQNEFKIQYFAKTDAPTPVNLTHHSYFNLKGKGDIEDHFIKIRAQKFTPVYDNLIPKGIIKDVAGTPFDFRVKKKIGQDIQLDHEQLNLGDGYDHNFVIDDWKENKHKTNLVAKVEEETSGRILEVFSNEPGLQFYTAHPFNSKPDANVKRTSFCLEIQHFPDSPNQDNFPSTLLYPGESYEVNCIYKFATT